MLLPKRLMLLVQVFRSLKTQIIQPQQVERLLFRVQSQVEQGKIDILLLKAILQQHLQQLLVKQAFTM